MLTLVLASPRQIDQLAFGAYRDDGLNVRLTAARAELQEAIACCRRTSPAVVVIDMSYPDWGAIRAARDLHREGFPGHFVFLDDRVAVWRAHLALCMERACYFTREGRLRDLFDYLVRRTTACSTDRVARAPASPPWLIYNREALHRHDVHGVLTLSEKEIDIMRRMASGQAAREVAEARGVAVKTVENHRTRIMRKLAVNRTVDVTRIALETGVIGSI